jgi:hypothetical protein
LSESSFFGAVLPRRREPEVSGVSLVELIGIEPTTSSLQSWRSTN